VAARITLEKRLGGWLSGAGDALVSVFFPAGCRLCDRLLIRASAVPICEKCLASFPALGGALCSTCGQPLSSWSLGSSNEQRAENLVCPECQGRSYAFDRVRSDALYQGPLIRAIMLLKFERMEPLGCWFAERLTEVARREAMLGTVDVVVPVPVHRQRGQERGYNQADLIARPLARKLCVRTAPFCWSEPSPAPTSTSSVWKSAGNRYVALLPRVRGAKLTTYAYCW
jgi:predicted amidophosphoribosyltransferase